jgi:hypothetical protein
MVLLSYREAIIHYTILTMIKRKRLGLGIIVQSLWQSYEGGLHLQGLNKIVFRMRDNTY